MEIICLLRQSRKTNYSTCQIKQKEQHKTQFCMPLSPVKSRHEGNWLHFTIRYGGTRLHPLWIVSFTVMIYLKNRYTHLQRMVDGLVIRSRILRMPAREQRFMWGSMSALMKMNRLLLMMKFKSGWNRLQNNTFIQIYRGVLSVVRT